MKLVVHPRGGDSSLQIWLRLRGWLAGKSTKRNGSFNGKISYKWLYICLNNGCTISPTFLLSSGERRERFGAMGIHVLHEMGSQGTWKTASTSWNWKVVGISRWTNHAKTWFQSVIIAQFLLVSISPSCPPCQETVRPDPTPSGDRDNLEKNSTSTSIDTVFWCLYRFYRGFAGFTSVY